MCVDQCLLQNNDSMVRDASCEALAAYAWALTEATGGPLPGSSTSSPLVKVIFDSLTEQKKEAQLGASQALLLVRALGLMTEFESIRRQVNRVASTVWKELALATSLLF